MPASVPFRHSPFLSSEREELRQFPSADSATNDLMAAMARLSELDEPKELAVPLPQNRGASRRRDLATRVVGIALAVTIAGLILALAEMVPGIGEATANLTRVGTVAALFGACIVLPLSLYLYATSEA